MKKNWFRFFLRIWIAITSLVGFVGGWIFLGHSGKPAAITTAAAASSNAAISPLPTLAPLPSLDDLNAGSTGFQQLPQQTFTFSAPRFRTRGS